jgi:hypothetical protein
LFLNRAISEDYLKKLIPLLLAAAAAASGQETIDHSGAARVSPYPIRAFLPGACKYGDHTILSTAAAPNNVYECGTSNDWNQIGAGGGGGGTWGSITGTLSAQTDLSTALTGKQAALGFTPLNAASNLSDLASAPTARTNLGLAAVAASGSYNDLSNKPTNIATATALAATGTQCSAGNYARGVDASGNAQNCTAAATGNALTSNPLSQFAATTSAQLLATLSDPTGTGPAVFGTSPTITTPRIAQINDTNGNAEVIYTTTASAVNQITNTNAATGGAPLIAATGSDTNIGLSIKQKGPGTMLLGVTSNPIRVTNSTGLNVDTLEVFDGNGAGTWIQFGNGLSGVRMGNVSCASWTAATPVNGTLDLGLCRNTGGVLEVNSGTFGTFRDMKYRTQNLTGLTATYNNLATAGMGNPPIYAVASLTGQAASIGTTNLQCGGAVCPAGQYRVAVYSVVTATGTGTLSSTIGWNDGTAARTITSTGVATTATNFEQPAPYIIRADGVNNITYATTLSVSGTYSLYISLERLQ